MSTDQWARIFEIVPIGLFSGLLAGAFGVGGGIISVPLVRHVLGLTAHEAVGSTLAMILPTAAIGVFNYLKQGKIVPRLALISSLPAIIGTVIASEYSHNVNGSVLMLMLAGLMLLVAFDFLTGAGAKLKAKSGDESSEDDVLVMDKRKSLIAAFIGLVVGLMSGLLGIGGGFVMVPAYCYFLGLPLKAAFGTSLIVVALVALPGTVVHAMHKHVLWWVVIPMLGGSLPGAWLGSYFSLKAKDQNLRTVFGIILIVMAIVFAARELNIGPH